LPSDAVDEVAPQVVAAPRDAESARALIAWAGREKLAVIARGGGTRLEIGARPERFDILVSTRHLNRIIEHDVGNTTVCAESGISLRELNNAVRAQNQFVPLLWAKQDETPHEETAIGAAATREAASEKSRAETSHDETPHDETAGENPRPDLMLSESTLGESTLGGVVAANAAGAGRMKFGAPRDLVVGLDAALSNGRLVRSGSKVVKNVSGYDLNKILVGSFGSLGLLTRITLRLRPQDEASQSWNRAFATWAALESGAMSILDGAFEPTILQARIGTQGFHLHARFDGVRAAVEAQLKRLPHADDPAHEYSWDGPKGETTVQMRAILPLRDAAWWAQSAQKAGARHIVWDCGTGALRASFCDVPDVAALREQAVARGGALIIERAPAAMKTSEWVWGAPRSDFFLMKRLKERFDAANICAPGRFVGGL